MLCRRKVRGPRRGLTPHVRCPQRSRAGLRRRPSRSLRPGPPALVTGHHPHPEPNRQLPRRPADLMEEGTLKPGVQAAVERDAERKIVRAF